MKYKENVNKIYHYTELMIENKDLRIPNTWKAIVDRNSGT